MRNGCDFILLRGARKGERCRYEPANYEPENDAFYCKRHFVMAIIDLRVSLSA